MTQLCYTLEEAADKLNFSETILVRLSQYFKIPQAAYEEVGYLSFKGDLIFGEEDLAFFGQVKERLLLGESLDEVKTRLPKQAIRATAANRQPVGHAELGHEPAVLGGVSPTAAGELPPMREIQDRKPYEKAAEKSFERYKSMHRTSIGKVFENMLKEVAAPQPGRRPETAVPEFRPMRKAVADPEAVIPTAPPHRGDAILPFSNRSGMHSPSSGNGLSQPTALKNGLSPLVQAKFASSNAVWEPLIQQAAQKPRTMNINLKNAAALLRERALGHAPQQEIV